MHLEAYHIVMRGERISNNLYKKLNEKMKTLMYLNSNEGIRKTIAKFSVIVDFHLYYTEPDSPHGNTFEGGGLFVRKQLKGGGLFKRGGIIKSLQYASRIVSKESSFLLKPDFHSPISGVRATFCDRHFAITWYISNYT